MRDVYAPQTRPAINWTAFWLMAFDLGVWAVLMGLGAWILKTLA